MHRVTSHTSARTCGRLCEEYEARDLADTIVRIVTNEPTEEVSPEDAVLSFIKYLEGVRIRLRELHWSAEHNSMHKLTDDMIEELEEYEDSIAEDYMGIIGIRIKVGDVVPRMPEQTTLKDLLGALVDEETTLIASIEDNDKFIGIKNIVEEMVHYTYKCTYLEPMA